MTKLNVLCVENFYYSQICDAVYRKLFCVLFLEKKIFEGIVKYINHHNECNMFITLFRIHREGIMIEKDSIYYIKV